MKKALALLIGVMMLALPVSAQTYSVVYPAWVPVSGGAWVEADTTQGQICVVVPLDYRSGYFGFSGSGYNVANLTSTSISGTAMHKAILHTMAAHRASSVVLLGCPL